jgi:hypothetical protein
MKENIRMKRFFVIVALATSIVVSGCGLAYNAKRNELLKTAKPSDYGPPPPANYCEIQKQVILSSLKDPQSAQFQWGNNPIKEIIPTDFTSPNPILVWVTSAQVNGKNSFGGYTGFKPYLFAWKDGKIYAIAFPNETNPYRPVGFWQYLGK